MLDTTRPQIAGLQLEGVAQSWWEIESKSPELYIELNPDQSSSSSIDSQIIGTWDDFCQAL